MTTKSEGMMIPGKLKWRILPVFALVALAFCGTAAAEQLYVNESGWWRDDGAFNESTAPIQAAVDAAAAGDAIFVWNGSYTENVDVNKTLTLEGEGADVITVTAVSSGDHVFEVTADHVNISGFAVRGAGYSGGICLYNADHCDISNNTVSNNADGIIVYSINNTLKNNTANSNTWCGICIPFSSNNTLTGNTASSNRYGIRLSSSSNNMLTSNTASDNYHGIWLSSSSDNTLIGNIALRNSWGGIRLFSSSNNTLTGNIASRNSYGINLWGSINNTLQDNAISGNEYNFGIGGYGYDLSHYIQNIDASNTVDERPIYYWVDQKDNQIPSDAGFVGVVNSTNITIRDMALANNVEGVLFVGTVNSRIENVTTSNNGNGICLYDSSNNTLKNNTANSNRWYGIHLQSSGKVSPNK